MLCASLGTPFDPSDALTDAIVFLEDVGEHPYQVDRMLCQLGLCGLDRAQAIVFGHCRQDRHGDRERAVSAGGCADRTAGSPSAFVDQALLSILADHQVRLGVPIYYGVDAGHGQPNLALPLGGAAVVAEECLTLSLMPRID